MSYHPHVRAGDTISGHGLKHRPPLKSGDTISGHAFHGMQGTAHALGPNQPVPTGPPLQAGPVMKFSQDEIDAAMVRLSKDVLTDVLANAAYLELARPYEREEHGKLQEVSGYAVHRMLGIPADQDVEPLVDYSRNGFYDLNKALWDGTEPTPEAADLRDKLDGAFSRARPSEKPAVVYRDPGWAKSGVPHRLQAIHLPAGSKVLSVMNARKRRAGEYWYGDQWDEDKEVLLPRGATFRDGQGLHFTTPGFSSTTTDLDQLTQVLDPDADTSLQHLWLEPSDHA